MRAILIYYFLMPPISREKAVITSRNFWKLHSSTKVADLSKCRTIGMTALKYFFVACNWLTTFTTAKLWNVHPEVMWKYNFFWTSTSPCTAILDSIVCKKLLSRMFKGENLLILENFQKSEKIHSILCVQKLSNPGQYWQQRCLKVQEPRAERKICNPCRRQQLLWNKITYRIRLARSFTALEYLLAFESLAEKAGTYIKIFGVK